MLIGAVVNDKVHNKPHAALMYFGKENIKILHCSELFHYLAVVADIIAVIVVRRIVNGTAPDCVDSKRFKVVKLADDALKIADAVSV